MRRFKAGSFLPSIILDSVNEGKITIPSGQGITHLQFRRFAGCPMCNLHLHQFKTRASELAAANIHEVVVFHSSAQRLQEFQNDTPFAMIADPGKQLYRQFAVQESIWAIAHPVALFTAIYAFISGHRGTSAADESISGLPAEFLINEKGEMIAVHYGRHGSDHWSVDDVIRKSKSMRKK
ncbi:MAG TPA: peroxiredoxin-like family protein [Cellvibrionaceae bacterium]